MPFSELHDPIKKDSRYEPGKEEDFRRQQAVANAERREQDVQAKIWQMIQNSGLKARLKIIQITDDGALATGFYVSETEYESKEYRTISETKTVGLAAPGRPGTVTVQRQVPVKTEKRISTDQHPLPDRIYVVGVPSNLVDGDLLTATIFPCGRHQYITVMGGKSTVERYAMSPTIAKKLLGY
jgi:hypothetical protein